MDHLLRRRQTSLCYASLAGIGVVAALLAIGVVDLYEDHSAETVLPAVVATVCSSLLWWWVFIVRPRRAGFLPGLLAGVVSTMSAIPLGLVTGVLMAGLSPDLNGWQVLYAIGFWGLLGVSLLGSLLIYPPAWGLFLFGGFVGGLAALTLRAGLMQLEAASTRAGGAPAPPGLQATDTAGPPSHAQM